MTSPERSDTPPSARDLRASLLAATAAPASGVRGYQRPGSQREVPALAAPPSPPELLTSSPNLQRLCESYHRAHLLMLTRSRRQRIGIASLVGAVAVGSLVLRNSGVLNPDAVTNLVGIVAAVSCAGLAVLATLWMRDDRRLRSTQGERFLRAIQFNCDLPSDRIEAIRVGAAQPTRLFLDCYSVWCGQHRPLRGGLAMFAGGRGMRAA